MDDFSIGAFLGAFCGALLATPFWVRKMMAQLDKLKSCAHCHNNTCPSIQPVIVDRQK